MRVRQYEVNPTETKAIRPLLVKVMGEMIYPYTYLKDVSYQGKGHI